MDVEPLSLEELVDAATDINNYASNVTQAEAVAKNVNLTIGGANTVVKLLIQKIQQQQEVVTLQALTVVELCVKNCGVQFHNEIGKYKFINELIKLLSSKYNGDITPHSVKERVIGLMFSWYVGLPHEAKIAEAYKMLKQQGIVKRDPVDGHQAGNVPREIENTAFQDEGNTQLLKTLLSSNDAEDLHSANKLIKSMVKEEEERLDRVSKRIQVLETVANNVKLLDDMTGKYDPKTNADSMEIMNELYERCLTLRPELFRLASKNVDEKDDAVADILAASDELTRVIDLYKESVLFKKQTHSSEFLRSESVELSSSIGDTSAHTADTANFLLDLEDTSTQNGDGIHNSLLDEQLKMLGLSTPRDQNNTSQTHWNVNQANSVFKAPFNPIPMPDSSNVATMLPSSNILPPILNTQSRMPVYNSEIKSQPSRLSQPPPTHMATMSQQVSTKETPKTTNSNTSMGKDLFDFDIFESDFLKPTNNLNSSMYSNDNQSIGNSVVTIAAGAPQNLPVVSQGTATLQSSSTVQNVIPPTQIKQQPLKPRNVASQAPIPTLNPVPIPKPVVGTARAPTPNPLVGTACAPTPNPVAGTAYAPTPNYAPIGTQTCVPPAVQPAPAVVALPSPPSVTPVPTLPAPGPVQNTISQTPVNTTSPVNYIVPLEALKPGKYSPIPILDKDGLKTFLIIAEDTREDANANVTVSILSTISLNTVAVTGFSIQVAVPKVMRVKLQPATSNELTPFNPIFPPNSISQVMLIANPTKEVVKLRFKLTYTIGGMLHVETCNIDELPVI